MSRRDEKTGWASRRGPVIGDEQAPADSQRRGRRGRHGAPDSQGYGPPPDSAPQARLPRHDPYGPADPYQSGDGYRPASPYGPPDPGGSPDPYGPPGSYGPADPYGPPSQPGGYGAADPYGAGAPGTSPGGPDTRGSGGRAGRRRRHAAPEADGAGTGEGGYGGSGYSGAGYDGAGRGGAGYGTSPQAASGYPAGPYGPPGPYGRPGPQDLAGPADLPDTGWRPAAGPYGPPDPYGPAEHPSFPGVYGAPRAVGPGSGPHSGPQSFTGPQDWAAGAFGSADPYSPGQAGGGRPGPYGPPDPYGPQEPGSRGDAAGPARAMPRTPYDTDSAPGWSAFGPADADSQADLPGLPAADAGTQPGRGGAGSRGFRWQPPAGASAPDYPSGVQDFRSGPARDYPSGVQDYPSQEFPSREFPAARDYPSGVQDFPSREFPSQEFPSGAMQGLAAGQGGAPAGRGPGTGPQRNPRGPARRGQQPPPGRRTAAAEAARAGEPEWAGEEQHAGFFSGFGQDESVDPPRRKRGRLAAPLVSIVVILALVGSAGFWVVQKYRAAHADYSGSGQGTVTFVVKSGATSFDVAPGLVKAGVIAATGPFISAAKATPNPGLTPGTFHLHKHMNAKLAWALLTDPKSRVQTTVTITDGQRNTVDGVLASLSRQTGKPVAMFKAALRNTKALGLPSYAHGNPEGYLFPATYNFPPGTTPLKMLQTMVKAFRQQATAMGLAAAAKAGHLTPAEVVIQASLVEAEVDPRDYAKAARVIDNRINNGMPLGLDSTVLFALHKTGFALTTKELAVKSPYNTFLHKGLPPGPIDSPGVAAIKAVLHPDSSAAARTWLWFVTIDPKTGRTGFTASESQFEKWVKESNQNIKNGT